jgi:hypothetical protein
MAQLHKIYNATIRTYANLNIWPGTVIYVDPRGWVPEMDPETREIYGRVGAIETLGLGGYFNTVKLSHVFESGNFETQIDARWFTNSITESKNAGSSTQAPSSSPKSKCKGAGSTEKVDSPTGPCHGASAARKEALTGLFGVEKMGRYLLQENGDFGDEPNPSSNPD